MRTLVVVASLSVATVLSACRVAEGDDIPRSLPGVYEYQAAGRAFGHPWSFDVELELKRDGTYELVTHSDIDGDRDRDVDRGRYIVRDGSVLLGKSNADRVDEDEAHRLEIRGDSLRTDMPWIANAALRLAGASKPILVKRDR